MQQAVIENMYEKVLKKSRLFNKILSENCLKSLCNVVEEKIYMPDELIYETN